MDKVIPHAVQSDAEIDALIDAGKNEPIYARAISAVYLPERNRIAVAFDNGIVVVFPVAAMRELADKTPAEISEVQVTFGGDGLRWEKFDIDYYLPNMMDGFAPSCRVEMAEMAAEMGRRGGSKTSPAKAAVARANGAKGGRPRKVAVAKT